MIVVKKCEKFEAQQLHSFLLKQEIGEKRIRGYGGAITRDFIHGIDNQPIDWHAVLDSTPLLCISNSISLLATDPNGATKI